MPFFENESDVEQKFIYPLLSKSIPGGLGIPSFSILTKVSIRRFEIDKGKSKKQYYPDYLIHNYGLPLMVIEAKGPEEDIQEGYRQARLYANEINALYPNNISPVKCIIACNGVDLWYGLSDTANPLNKIKCSDFGVYTQAASELVEFFSWGQLCKHGISVYKKIDKDDLFKPVSLIGGSSIQKEEVSSNTFGATVASSISNIINPENVNDKINIVKSAYVSSRRRERYVDPIDKVIRAAKPPSEVHAVQFEDTSNPVEIVKKFDDKKSLEHKVLLVIGSVGAGKTTFIDHLQYVALPEELINSTLWCRINMNNAPVSSNEIYSWLRSGIIESCRNSLPEIDFDDLEVIKKIYGVELSKFTKGIGKLYEGNSSLYFEKMGEHLESIVDDEKKVANAHLRYACGERGKLCIIVLDNCDKKNRDEQLLMFEAAQWLQNEFRCLVILPLRDETFDNHQNEPPLDTVLKDMVFRIEPPLFQQVLINRIKLALGELGKGRSKKLTFNLPNGIKVNYPQSDQAYYLTSILKSLFEHDRFARRIIMGLAGRNIRKALEIFLEFCNSAYISEEQIVKIKQSRGKYVIPYDQVAIVLLRMNRRFYDDKISYIKNLFSRNPGDVKSAHFCRYLILVWLKDKFYTAGDSGLKGYFKKHKLKASLLPYGLSSEIIDREIDYLLKSQCIIAEHLRLDSLEDEDLIRLGPAGFVHLELTQNVTYLGTIVEDTLFDNRDLAYSIGEKIRLQESQLHPRTYYDNALCLLSYLNDAKPVLYDTEGHFYKNDTSDDLLDLNFAEKAMQDFSNSRSHDAWFNAIELYRPGSMHTGTVTNMVDFGSFVEFESGLSGLVYKDNHNGMEPSVGEHVRVEIENIDLIKRRIALKLVSIDLYSEGDLVKGSNS
ncbi:type I restriction endonuclease [Vreelandella titanicae]|uniref:type I restriction endonuclease n=1 Tax=Vreelandella titanicae TaxID=664683 RepID=UPI003D035537|tara:strand:- start:1473 stop:4139 length:2667 start_codon:yes stop_codon:yes gene_type:complete